MNAARIGTRVAYLLAATGLAAIGPAVARAQPRWVKAAALEPRTQHAMAYDPARGQVVLSGGWSRAYNFSDTWEWNGAAWTIRNVAGPTARFDAAMAYDGAGVLLFGGQTGTSVFNDTWAWNGAAWTGIPTNPTPAGRFGHAMAYDPVRGRVVLFGGGNWAGTRLNDTWEWNGASWTQMFPPVSPPARYYHSLAYDSVSRGVLLFGGTGAGGAALGDTWIWNGTIWTLGTPATSPPARDGLVLAENVGGGVVLFGGSTASGHLSDTWTWNGAAWAQQTLSTNPGVRRRDAMSRDPAGQVVLFGGFNGDVMGDTWTWSGTTWTNRSAGTHPTPRAAMAMTYDRDQRRTLLHGGFTGNNVGRWGGPFAWDGIVWTRYTTPLEPGNRDGHAMVYDQARRRAVLFGGDPGGGVRLSDTWEWDGASMTWQERARDPSFRPAGRSYHAMAYDPSRGRTVLFGGGDAVGILWDTWEWDGTAWMIRTSLPSPLRRWGHAMAYAGQGKVLLFGGTNGATRFNDTWEWDGAAGAWTQRSPATIPPARSYHALAYDSARGRVVLFGGEGPGSGQGLADTWEWDGSNWSQVVMPLGPQARWSHAMAYDEHRGRVVLFGGSLPPSGREASDTWEFSSGPTFTLTATSAPGQLSIWIGNYPPTSTDIWLLASSTTTHGAPGTGQFFGLYFPDFALSAMLRLPSLAGFLPHFPWRPPNPDPYGPGPWILGPGPGLWWDLTAIAYDLAGGRGVVGQTGVVRVFW